MVFGITKQYVWAALPISGFLIGAFLDRKETERMTMFRDKSALYGRKLKEGEAPSCFNYNRRSTEEDGSDSTTTPKDRDSEALSSPIHPVFVKYNMNSNEGKDIAEKDEFSEKTLAELGYNSCEIEDWDKIVQPQKKDLLELIYEMVSNYKRPDVQIVTGKTTFNCHMIVLQCYSKFFMNDKNHANVIVLPEDKVSPGAFIIIYEWMLAKHPKVSRQDILDVFSAASFLQIQGILDQCWVCIDDDERFCEDAAFLLYLEARKHNNELIQQLMLTRICKFFLTLVSSKEFLEMSFKEISTLLQSNAIGVYSESEVFMSAVRWIHNNYSERECYVVDLMKCIRFGLMVPWQLVELRRNQNSSEIQKIVDNPTVRSMIDDGLAYVTTKFYYGNDEKDYLKCLDRLQLIEPVERQWVRDTTWHNHAEGPNKCVFTYAIFLEYLEYIQSMGKKHWEFLEFNESGPFNDYFFDVRSYESNSNYLLMNGLKK